MIASATPDGNTHGSICEIHGRWYVFYHRQTGTDEYARQAMVAPIEVKVEEGKGGKVEISEGEYNSEGFELDGLDPLERHSAGLACWYTGPKPATHEWPNNTFYGSYVAATYGSNEAVKTTADTWKPEEKFDNPYDLRYNTNPVVNNTDGSIVGYKYFNFDALMGKKNVQLLLTIIPEGIDGTIEVMVDRPWFSQDGELLGKADVKADMTPGTPIELAIPLQGLSGLAGKHAIFFVFKSDTKEKSICTLNDFIFSY